MYQGTGELKKIFKVQSQVHMNQKNFKVQSQVHM